MHYLNKDVMICVRERERKKTRKELGLQWNVAYGMELSEMDRGDTSVFLRQLKMVGLDHCNLLCLYLKLSRL